jgi:hypothetical protein
MDKKQNDPEIKTADYFLWRVLQVRKDRHDERVRQLYNMRARERYTKH